MEDIPNTTAHLKGCFEELKAVYKGTARLHLAAEYMLDNLFRERLNNEDLLPLGEKKDHLLVETSYYNPPANMYGLLERIKAKGFYPVLAHPERYMYMTDGDYMRLKEMGVLFQANLFSFIGVYGKEVKSKTERLQYVGLYDILGTDIHDVEHWRRVSFVDCIGTKKIAALRAMSKTEALL